MIFLFDLTEPHLMRLRGRMIDLSPETRAWMGFRLDRRLGLMQLWDVVERGRPTASRRGESCACCAGWTEMTYARET